MREDPDRQQRFLEALRPHRGVIVKVVKLYARGAAEREDLESEIVLQLWRSFEGYRGEASFATFLYRVALNTALMWARHAGSGPRMDCDVAVEELGRITDEHDDENVRRLYAVIRALRPVERALVLLALEGRSHREIAEVMGLSVDNVGVRLSRCRTRLRQAIFRVRPVPE